VRPRPALGPGLLPEACAGLRCPARAGAVPEPPRATRLPGPRTSRPQAAAEPVPSWPVRHHWRPGAAGAWILPSARSSRSWLRLLEAFPPVCPR